MRISDWSSDVCSSDLYVFHDTRTDDYHARYRRLGQFVPEGSKSGAAAAAVYVTHQVLPLDHAHFGRLPRQNVLAAEAFIAGSEPLSAALKGVARVAVPVAPDRHLECQLGGASRRARVWQDVSISGGARNI